MELVNWKAIVEALLFAVGDDGMSLEQLCGVLEIDRTIGRDIIADLQQQYNEADRGIHLLETGGMYMLATKKEHTVYLQRLFQERAKQSLSQAALETLAIVAYRQPITRLEIEEIRGVKVDRPLQTLVTRALICEKGRADAPGRPILYGTTTDFLHVFGLKSLDDLPPLSEAFDDATLGDEADLFFSAFRDNINNN